MDHKPTGIRTPQNRQDARLSRDLAETHLAHLPLAMSRPRMIVERAGAQHGRTPCSQPKRRRIAAVVLGLMLVVAACTGDDDAAAPSTTTQVTPTTSAGAVIEISAEEFAFDPAELRLAAGTEVTLRLVNDGAILHNIDIPELGVFVEAQAGTTAEVTLTVPGAPALFTWFCSIPGHREAGMDAAGTING